MAEQGPFKLRGVNHLALVCADMDRTIDFYENVLGLPVMMTVDLPNDMGKHFFFDIGNGDTLAFFWFKDGPAAVPAAMPTTLPAQGEFLTPPGTMNHIAINVSPDDIHAYAKVLRERGIECSKVTKHDNSKEGWSRTDNDKVFLKSLYFFDPDGILLEFACWMRDPSTLTDSDVNFRPETLVGADIAAAGARA
ncbi:VOC family protein [Pseudonocardia ailaonensis]|uniref:VOC family protein n=1 Tax=Pseudonocardia ailaonensis TaxID=367279 RepID=A0ABN2NCQ2_9PSEU